MGGEAGHKAGGENAAEQQHRTEVAHVHHHARLERRPQDLDPPRRRDPAPVARRGLGAGAGHGCGDPKLVVVTPYQVAG